MIEAYAFLAAFAAQILAASVVSPARLIRYVRGWAGNFGSERFAEIYPGVDYSRWVERFVIRYRAANFVIAVIGLLLLGWMFSLIQHPDWTGEVVKLVALYVALQFSPLILVSLNAVVRHSKMLAQASQEVKRTALLQRRGLFDFVSPSVVLLAVVSYLLFVAYAIYLDLHVYHNTSLSRPCYGSIGAVTLVYALNAFIIYKYLYGRKNPLVTHEGRVHMIAGTVKVSVYGSIASVWFMAVFGTLGQPGLQDWRPFALTVFFVITSLFAFIGATAPPRKPESGRLGESPAS